MQTWFTQSEGVVVGNCESDRVAAVQKEIIVDADLYHNVARTWVFYLDVSANLMANKSVNKNSKAAWIDQDSRVTPRLKETKWTP